MDAKWVGETDVGLVVSWDYFAGLEMDEKLVACSVAKTTAKMVA